MARPKTNPEKHRKGISLTLDPKTLAEAQAEAQRQGYSLSVVVDALLVGWLVECWQSKAAAAEAAPVIVWEEAMK
jgi:hypothetical protein